MRIEKKEEIFEIKEEIDIGNGTILEVGDKIKLLSENNEIADIIRQQLGHKAFYMMGAKDYVALPNGLQFKIRGSQNWNTIIIRLNGKDLYDVTFLKIRAMNISNQKEYKDIYVDQLKELIENETKLYLSLF